MTHTADPGSPFLHDWVIRHAATDPGRPALATTRVRLAYGELADRAVRLAGNLSARGVGPGDRVLVVLPNTAATVVVAVALSMLGAVAVEANRRAGAEVLAAVLARSGAGAAVVWAADLPTWTAVSMAAALDHAWIVHAGMRPDGATASQPGWSSTAVGEDGAIDEAAPTAPIPPSGTLDPAAPALILFTSGSTGSPLGVIQTHRNIAANTRSIVAYLGLAADDRALLTLPLHYCYGRSVLQTHLFMGGSVVLQDGFVFARPVVERLTAERCTGFAGVPLTFELIRREVDLSAWSLPDLRYVTQAGGAMDRDTIAWARRAFAPAQVYVMYGQTEATARLSYLPPERAADKDGSIGIPVPGVELRVVDEQGRELGVGEVGELVARGDNVTPGYLDDPEATAAILRDGWLWTGDLASRDADGFLWHQGRVKEILKVGGYRVSPGRIEAVLASQPGVAAAAVCGRPHPVKGEVPVAFLALADGVRVDLDALRDACRARLEPHMVPVELIVLDALPRNEAGKVLRARLRELAAVGHGSTPISDLSRPAPSGSSGG